MRSGYDSHVEQVLTQRAFASYRFDVCGLTLL
jgi:hypothetical protein